MTICIAAIGIVEKGGRREESIVFATDRMLTYHGIGQFESSLSKHRQLNNFSVAMISGQPLIFEDILEGAREQNSLKEVKEKIHENMGLIREERIRKMLLEKFRLSYDELKGLLGQPELNDIADEIVEAVNKFSLQTEVLLIGFQDGEAHIFAITEQEFFDCRDMGFLAIGSGAQQSANTLMFQQTAKSNPLKVVIYNVYKAKRNSEVVAGVGKETDMFVMSKDGAVAEVEEDQIAMLAEVYSQEMKLGKEHPNLDVIARKIKED